MRINLLKIGAIYLSFLMTSCNGWTSKKNDASLDEVHINELKDKAKAYSKGIKTRSMTYMDMHIKFITSIDEYQSTDWVLEKQNQTTVDLNELCEAIFLGDAYLKYFKPNASTNFHLASNDDVPSNGFIDKFNVTIVWFDENEYRTVRAAFNRLLFQEKGVSLLMLERTEGIYENARKAKLLLDEAYKRYLKSQNSDETAYGLYHYASSGSEILDYVFIPFDDFDTKLKDYDVRPYWMQEL